MYIVLNIYLNQMIVILYHSLNAFRIFFSIIRLNSAENSAVQKIVQVDIVHTLII